MLTALIIFLLVLGCTLLGFGLFMARLTVTTMQQVRAASNSLHQKIERDRLREAALESVARPADWNSQGAQQQRRYRNPDTRL